ncbi:putative Origin recognition complex subunit 1 (putative) [Rhodotorula toruloides]|nr:putative Origin recognition complex subunit 1 (putative) [Rhodotorula toruloides]
MNFAIPASEQAAAKAAAEQNDATEWIGEVSGGRTVQYDEDREEMTVIQEDGLHRRAQLKANSLSVEERLSMLEERMRAGESGNRHATALDTLSRSQETYLAVAGAVYALTGGPNSNLFVPSQAEGRVKAIQAVRRKATAGEKLSKKDEALFNASSQVSDAVLKVGLEAARSALSSQNRGDVVHAAPIKDDWEEFIAGPVKNVQPQRAAEYNKIFNVLKDAKNDRDSASSDSNSGSEGDESDDDSASDDDRASRTPTKRKPQRERQASASSSRKTAATRLKRTRPATSAATGRAAKRRKFASSGKTSSDSSHNALPPLLQSAHLASFTPFERAKALLHVSATPESLPWGEDQREQIRQFIGNAVLGRSGGCLYVHGVPGTGKTATVHSVVRELQNDEDMDAFAFVEINGMKISEPMAAFSHLWAALAPPDQQQSGRKVSPKAALAALENHFANPDPARKTTVVLVDELDQMLTKRQDVLYNFFNWPHIPHSRLVVLAVAHPMDLPERELSGKIRSRLGTNRIPFQPYTWTELKRILEARLALVDPSSAAKSKSTPFFDDVALQKIAKSVAGISGDARKALDVARRALDRVALRLSKEGKSLDELEQGKVKCSIQDATQAYNDMTRQGPAAFVRKLSTQMKVLLLAVAQCVRRAGVPEVELETHLDFLRQTSLCPTPSSTPSKTELVALLSQLHSLRLVTAESQRLDVFQRVRPAVDEGDLFAALREDEVLKAHVPKVL